MFPSDGATLRLGDDADPDTDGVQVLPTARVVGLAAGDTIEMRVDGTVMATAPVMSDGRVIFGAITLASGANTLVAATAAGDTESAPVTVTVSETCFNTTFVSPMPPMGGNLTLGMSDDTDGEMCGTTFETTVILSTDAGSGATANILVNGTRRASGTVNGTTATFNGIALDNRGSTANTLAVEVVSADGATRCMDTFPASIFVDCDGPSCEITLPDTMSAFLNQDDDNMPGAPFTTNFQATTDAAGLGQDIRLIVDGNETDALSSPTTAVGTGGQANFADVMLSEGVHRVRAECTDGAGNVTRSGASEWTVDITPCSIMIDAPGEGDLFTDNDDENPGLPAIQIIADGTSAGNDCSGIRVGLCGGLDAMPYDAWEAAWVNEVTLSSSATQNMCAEVVDLAGNTARVMRGIMVRTDSPQLEIVTPATGTAYNAMGTVGRIADLDPGTTSCEAMFVVNCTDVGQPVELIRSDLMSLLVGGTATCTAMSGLPAPYLGQATFPAVSLPSLASLVTLEITARQSADGLTGTSDPITVLSDCAPPDISIGSPACGATLTLAMDMDASQPGLQRGVTVRNANVPMPPVDLTLTPGMVYMSSTTSGVNTTFTGVTFPAGVVQMQACATDMAGNTGCEPRTCTVTVVDLPSVMITQPTEMALIGPTPDCDPATPGLQIMVHADTDAPPGSMARVQVGPVGPPTSFTTTASGLDACVNAPDGVGISVHVEITDTRGTGSDDVIVTVDTMPPTNAISDFTPNTTMLVDRRGGIVQYAWTDVADAGGGLLTSYQLRCSTTGPITNETEWTAATVQSITVVPMASGTGRTANVGGHRLADERWCVLRGVDPVGALTPLPTIPPASVTIPTLTSILSGSTAGDGAVVTGVGDVNGDGVDDILVGSGTSASTGDAAYIYFGHVGGPSTAPDVTILGPTGATGGWSLVASSAGDMNGDGLGDFAISARAASGLSGQVFVFFGRTTWPAAAIDLSGGCVANVCVTGAEGGLLGYDLAAVDFDGDGLDDLAMGAWRVGSGSTGKVYILRGRMTFAPAAYTVPSAAEPEGWVLNAAAGTYAFGASITTCGDLNGDVREDLLIGAPGNESTMVTGRLYRVDGVAYAGTGMLNVAGSSATQLAMGDPADFGNTVRCVGDHDGDGMRDVAVHNASPGGGTNGVIQILYQSGGTYGSAASLVVNNSTSAASDLMGQTIGIGWTRFLGNVGRLENPTTDTMSDLLAGSRERGAAPGSVELFYGASTRADRQRLTADASFSPATTDTTGVRVAGYIGDIDGDGYNDFAVGDQNFMAGGGRVVVYY
ncbi:MAG: integrin alpha [Sandaracinaceae bacterium]